MSHDGVTGYWDPTDSATWLEPPEKPFGYEELAYLSPGRRMAVLYGELAAQVNGEYAIPADGRVSVKLAGIEICTITGKPDVRYLRKQLVYLRNYADLRLDRLPEINQQIYDLLSFMGSLGRLDASQKSYTLEFLTILQKLAFDVEMRVKHACWCPRPIDFSDYVMPMIQTPDHSTFPSGHACESFALATGLNECLHPAEGLRGGLKKWALPFRLAHRIAVNRTVAGVHFPVDSAAGAVLGMAIGDGICGLAKTYARHAAKPKASLRHLIFEPVALEKRSKGQKKVEASTDADDSNAIQQGHASKDRRFTFEASQDFESGWLRRAAKKFPKAKSQKAPVLPVLGQYWTKVQQEWQTHGSGAAP